jgi:hypothetical protein
MNMETIYKSACGYKHKQLNGHNYKDDEILKEGQGDQVQFRVRNAIDHVANV